MMYIGTSLGRCLRSLLLGDIPLESVLVIICRTKTNSYENFLGVVREYHEYGNPFATHSGGYDLSQWSWEQVSEIAHYLWHSGRIHQPRNFDSDNIGYIHPEMSSSLWVELVPQHVLTNQAVNESYQHFRMLAALVK